MFTVICPHCGDIIEILEINCKIFRHGVFKDTLIQIEPHLSKLECDRLFKEDRIFGCGKPFIIDFINDHWVALECDYI